jgi:hypothetical protein
MKAIFTILNLSKPERNWINWERHILVFSTVVTVGLMALYAYGKATSRW